MLRFIGLDFEDGYSGHQRIHSLEEFVAPRRLTVLFKAQLRVGCHSKGLLLHGPVIYPGWSSSGDFFSIALTTPCIDDWAGTVENNSY